MKRALLALALGVLLLLVAGVGTATASPPDTQSAGQLAGSDQGAGAAAGTAQEQPANENGSIRVLSPGDDGPVSQTNEASSDATAGNLNATEQTADQTQAGGSGLQAIGQAGYNDQDAFALALTAQQGASNENAPVRVLSPGDGGPVSQSNEASSDASAGNINATEQEAEQEQAGSGCCGGGGEQVIGQSADSEQDAGALAVTEQEKPSNTNITVRVLSPGDDGPVSQTNEASSNAEAGNLNVTKQTADQAQAGDSCKCGGAGEQVIGQSAENDQDAAALAATKQEKPSNTNISVRVLSPGDGGPVSQSNVASSNATAGNVNATEQKAEQDQAGSSCKCGGAGEQVIGQSAKSEQDAAALAATKQEKPSNENIGVRVLSPGDDGPVSQSNVATSNAEAGNLNVTKQDAAQSQAGGSGLQVIGQSAKNDQDALAVGLTLQKGASNENTPVRVLSPGDGGEVSQSNVASSNAAAGNANLTGQKAEQAQAGHSCKCGAGEQVIGQSAHSEQGAAAISATVQEKPSNSNAPVRVLSKGDDGPVWQSNEATSNATAGNLDTTWQSADQEQAGGSGLQVIGQSAKNEQDALAIGLTFQLGASNENAPVRVLSHGDGGPVSQSNVASSNAAAGNANWTGQHANQAQGGSMAAPKTSVPHASSCCGTGIQAIGQLAENRQGAGALAATVQGGSKQPCRCKDGSSIGNSNEPIRVLSHGDDGPVRQANIASSNADASNWNATKQAAYQLQARSCGCYGSHDIQAIGQLAKSDQLSFALAAGLQLGGSNTWAPERKESPGHMVAPTQKGKESAGDASSDEASTDQARQQVEG
jgi:hypothetical protein